MEQVRKPLQGVLNIIRFNRHFYIIGCILVLLMLCSAVYLWKSYADFIYFLCGLGVSSIIVSLLVSLYVYDLSGFYRLGWISPNNTESIIVNVNAGFDETSYLLQDKFKHAALIALDFYDPEKHTEVSIRRARKAYPPFPGTQQIGTSSIGLPANTIDKIFVILSAHEIRHEPERIAFFKELSTVIRPGGQIYVTEHLRDVPNFLAYNIGFFHFYSKACWHRIFHDAHLRIQQEIKLTPFISTFILDKNDPAL
jgi:hypothetical protein